MSSRKSTRRVDVNKVVIIRWERVIYIFIDTNDNQYYVISKGKKLRVDTLLLSDGEKRK